MNKIIGRKYRFYVIFFTIIFLLTTIFFLCEFQEVSAQSSEELLVTFIDVGQGDSSLLSTSSGFDILIDGGPSSAGQTVLSYLNAQGITNLEVIVISHLHADHIGGLIEVLQSGINVETIIYNGSSCATITCQDVWTEIGLRGITPIAVDAGDYFNWGSISTTILNPQPSPTGDENEDSVVMDVTFSDERLLYTGDIGFSTETLLMNQGVLAVTDILKVAHHGSAYSTSFDFLNITNPINAVISVGENSYGHPSPDTLIRLGNSGATTYRTDLVGNIIFTLYNVEPGEFSTTVFFPLIIHHASVEPTPEPTPAPTQEPTQEPTQPPGSMPGQNLQCNTSGNVEICASVSNANPSQYSYVTVYGQLVIGGAPQSGKPMYTTWNYKTTTSYCNEGVTGSGGVASCQRYISGASVGYQVNINVSIDGYSVTTSFTPTN